MVLLNLAASARAEQFTIADVSWTHSKDTTVDSHYHVNPSAETPTNLKTPVDWTKGSVHMVLDVKTKPPGDTPTKFQVCFEGSPLYVCAAQSPTWTKTGQLVWSDKVSNFYQGTDGLTPPKLVGIDYTKPIKSVALILKDTMNNKPQGDPKYVPTDLHIEVVWLSEGATYVPPHAEADAGAADPGSKADAGKGPVAAADAAAGSDAAPSATGPDASTSTASGTSRDAASSSPRADAASGSKLGDAGTPAGESADDDKDDSGCRVASPGRTWDGSLLPLALAWLATRRKRSRRVS
ncbi:MAG: hypothetical protein JWN48_3364 [Myxococcaceae bacterium]|nr:hypothetical protein [Myxococcaceae bacterium]